MNKHFRINLFAILVMGSFLLSACTSTAGTGVNPASTMATAESGMMMGTAVVEVPVTGEEVDELFINMMVPHHQGAVAMAQIALERSQRPEIQEMANAIITSQEEEIEQMRAWKLDWYGSSDTPPMSEMPLLQTMPGMEGGHPMDMQADVDALQNAAEPFDLAFIDAMIPHHQSAIDAANLVVQSAVHPDMRELAQGVIEEQQREIDQMLKWRQVWFPDAEPLSGTVP